MEKHTSPRKPSVVEPSATLQTTLWLDPTCGVRCLACMAIVVFHITWYVARAAEDKHAIDVTLAEHPWFTFLHNPEPAMQAFMCLTGYVLFTPPTLNRSLHDFKL